MSAFSGRGRGLHGQVVDELAVRILRGELRPGDILDPEAIMLELGVSRTVLREAFKVLGAKGLIDARPRLGTFVTERPRWQLLDVDVMNWRTQGEPDVRLVRELDEVRAIFEPSVARMAAVRRDDAQLARIRDTLEALVASHQPGGTGQAEADIAFHSAVLDASGNELLERFQVVLEPALHARDRVASQHATTLEFLDKHRAVFEAIEAQDAEAAFERMHALMQQSAADSAAIFDAYDR